MATITSAADGLWSAGTTWVGGAVPIDGDTVIIAPGHNVVFDVDMSTFPNGIAGLTISGSSTLPAILRCKHDVGGNYYLKLKSDTYINGAYQSNYGQLIANSDGTIDGTGELPLDCKFTINFSGTTAGYLNASYLKLNLRCAEPSVTDIGVVSANVGSAVLTVDTDISDNPYWVVGADVILEGAKMGVPDTQPATIIAVSPTTVTLSVEVDSVQKSDARLYLTGRNISLLSEATTSKSIISYCKDSYVGCAIRKTASTSTTTYGYGLYQMRESVFKGIISGCDSALYACYVVDFRGIAINCKIGFDGGDGNTMSGIITGCANGILYGTDNIMTGVIKNCYNGVNYGTRLILYGEILNAMFGIGVGSTSSFLAGCTISGLYGIYGGQALGYNVQLNSTIQTKNYLFKDNTNSAENRARYVCIFGLGSETGFGFWTLGGVSKTEAYSVVTHGVPPIETAEIQTMQFEDNRRNTWCEIPALAVANKEVQVVFYAKLTANDTIITLPTFGIYDPGKPWMDANEVLASAQQIANTEWQTHTLSFTSNYDREIRIRVYGMGGNEYGTGSEKLHWFYKITIAGEGGSGSGGAYPIIGSSIVRSAAW